ncbi:hypothetical protein GCM10010359_53470 [Streptomyces morookaense]|nr:hypothetical protein GCM10010359_53470 [Streptomyces morookaense]
MRPVRGAGNYETSPHRPAADAPPQGVRGAAPGTSAAGASWLLAQFPAPLTGRYAYAPRNAP